MPQNFRNKLIDWYLENKRELPWRSTDQPYFIWLSEIILQQTRIDQGLPYYLKFIETYPNVEDLANASEEEVLKLWQGLGYYTRARNLHHTAKYISKELNGIFPGTYSDLIKLKGVGDYTASAIASVCYNEPTAVVDGNVYRVLARVFGIELKINESKGVNYFKKTAQKMIDPSDPGTFNQAIMEFGSRWCTPTNPNCTKCIFKDHCVAFKEKKVSELPVKTKKNKVKKLYYNYFVILSGDGKTIITKRTEKGFWHQLYEFPLIETKSQINLSDLKNLNEFKKLSDAYSFMSIKPYQINSIVHKLSHRHIYSNFWIVGSSQEFDGGVPVDEISNYPVARLIDKFISSFFCSEGKV